MKKQFKEISPKKKVTGNYCGAESENESDLESLSKLLAAQEALNRQLMDINNAVTPFRTREQVMKIIGEQMKRVVDFDSYYINAVLDNDKDAFFLDGLFDTIKQSPEIEAFLNGNKIVIDSISQLTGQGKADRNYQETLSTTIFNYADLPENLLAAYAIARMEKKVGLKRGILLPLHVQGKYIGRLVLSSFKANAFDENQFALLEKLCEPIAIGVSNVLLYEEMQAAKAEIEALNQQLMDINNAVTPFRTREQIVKIVGEQLRKIFAFDSFYINTFDQNGDFYKFFLDGLLLEIKDNPEVRDFINRKEFPTVNIEHNPFNVEYIQSLQIQCLRYADLPEDFLESYTIARVEKNLGLQTVLVLPLRLNGLVIGTVNLCSFSARQFSTSQFPLLEKIAEPIAIGVSNVLLYEEMQAAKSEIEALNQQLMDINNAVTPFRTREQVMRIIKEQLSKFVDFESFYISCNPNYYGFTNFFVLQDGIHPDVKRHPKVEAYLQKGEHAVNHDLYDGSILDEAQYENYPSQSFLYENLHADLLANYPIAQVEKELGFKSAIMLPLKIKPQTIGFLILSSFKADSFPESKIGLLEKLCEPIAIGVSNVLLYEEMQAAKAEIEEREKEKSLQIEITEAIIQNGQWNDRMQRVADTLQKYFQWDMLNMAFRLKDIPTDKDFSYMRRENGSITLYSREEWKQQGGLSIEELADTYPEFERLLLAVPNVYSGEAYRSIPSQLHQRVIQTLGFQSGLYLPFQSVEGMKGQITLSSKQLDAYSQADLDRLQRLLPALLLAMTKALTQEELALREKEKSFQVAVTHVLTNNRVWDDAFCKLAQTIDRFIPCDFFYIAFKITNYSYRKEQNGLWSAWDDIGALLQNKGWTNEEFKKHVDVLQAYASEAGICQGADHVELARFSEIAEFFTSAHGYRATLRLPFTFQGQKENTFLYLVSKQSAAFLPHHLDLLQKAIPALQLALENIFAFEDIEQREKEKSLQIAVTDALTSTRDWDKAFLQLANVVGEKIPCLNFSIAFSLENQVGNVYNFKKQPDKGFMPYDPVSEIINQGKATLQQYNEWSSELQNSTFLYEPNICVGEDHKKLVAKYKIAKLYHDVFDFRSSLRFPFSFNGQKAHSYLYLGSSDAMAFTEAHIAIIKQAVPSLQLALENLFAFEDIEQREKEKSLQIAVTNALTSTRDWDEAFMQMVKAIDKEIPCDYFHFSFLAHEMKVRNFSYKKIADGTWLRYDSLQEVLNDTGWTTEEHSAFLIPLSEFLSVPRICVGKEHEELANGNKLAKLCEQLYGYRSILNLPFTFNGQKVLTFIYMASKKFEGFTTQHLEQLQKIVPSLTLAFENLFAFEDIEQREKEKSLQVAVVNALTEEGSWEQKFERVARFLESVFDWDYISFTIASPQFPKAFSFERLSDNSIAFQDTLDSLKKAGITLEQANRFNEEDSALYTAASFANDSEYHKLTSAYNWPKVVAKVYGIRSHLFIPLPIGENGFMKIIAGSKQENCYSQFHLDFLQKLSSPVSLAIEKMLAFEEIGRREKEKTELLGISECIAAVRNRDELFTVINSRILPIIGSNQFINLSILEPEGEHYRILVSSGLETLKINQKVLDEISRPQLLKSSQLMMDLLKVQKPVIFSFTEANVKYPGNPSVARMKLIGVQQVMATALRSGGESLGVLSVHSLQANRYSVKDLPLFQSITDQLAVAVSNIFANEAIIEREKEKSLQLEAIDALTLHSSWEEKCFALAKTILAFLPFDYAVLGFENGEYMQHCYGFQRMGAEDYRTIQMQDFQQMAGITEAKYRELRRQFIVSTPLLLNGIDFENASRQFELLQLRTRMFKVNSCLAVPVSFNPCIQFTLLFFSRQSDLFLPSDLSKLQKIVPVLAITLEKIIALELVEGKQKEIEKQLEEIKKLQKQVEAENAYLQESIDTVYNYGDIIGTSQAMQQVYQMVSQVAGTDSTVLILGETGTGKELIARAIHNASSRKDKLLVKLNCAALPPNLIESELFGHERGSFTGAFERRIGKFELANKGTLFLDEIGELPIELQAKLLRALQEKEIERIGGKSVIKCDVRIIAATNRKLEEEVRLQKFRSDLFFRINIFPITLPPLNQRKEDIPLLANHFLQKFCSSMNKTITGIETSTLQALMAYHWPGNIRELENVIERAVIINKTKMLSINLGLHSQQGKVLQANDTTARPNADNHPVFKVKTYKDAERELILKTIEIAKGRIRGAGGAAELLQVNPTTLESRMKKLGLVKKNKFDIID